MSGATSGRLDRLFRLQDLDTMIREAQDPEHKRSEEGMGFKLSALEKLKSARARLMESIDPRDYRIYDRIAKRHHHVIVPVQERMCLGCYMGLPTSAVPMKSDPDQLLTCENCGRILYWLE